MTGSAKHRLTQSCALAASAGFAVSTSIAAFCGSERGAWLYAFLSMASLCLRYVDRCQEQGGVIEHFARVSFPYLYYHSSEKKGDRK